MDMTAQGHVKNAAENPQSLMEAGSRKWAAKNCAWSQGGLVRMGSL